MGRGRFVLRPAVGRVPAPFAIACNGSFVLHSEDMRPCLHCMHCARRTR